MPKVTGALQAKGAFVNILVGLIRADVRDFRKNLRPIPQPQQFLALIDTGADVTCLDPGIIKVLALSAKKIQLANVPATVGLIGSTLYRVEVTLMNSANNRGDDLVIKELEVCELPLKDLGIDAVIGRDILNQLRFNYDGPAQTFSLDWN